MLHRQYSHCRKLCFIHTYYIYTYIIFRYLPPRTTTQTTADWHNNSLGKKISHTIRLRRTRNTAERVNGARTTDTRRLRAKRAEKGRRADVIARHRAWDWRGTRPTRRRWSGNGSRAAGRVGENGSPGPDWTGRPAPRPAARSALARWRHAALKIGGVRGGGGGGGRDSRDSRWDFGPRVELPAPRGSSWIIASGSMCLYRFFFFHCSARRPPRVKVAETQSYFKTAIIAVPPRPFCTSIRTLFLDVKRR